MPISNGQYTFSIGRDVQLRMIGPDGENVDLSNVTNFERKPEYNSLDVPLLNGVNLHADIPKNWTGGFELARKDGQIDQLFARAEQAWHTGGIVSFGTVFAYITEADGSQTVEKFSSVSLRYEDPGQFGDKEVRQKIGFTAQHRDL